MLQDKRLDGGYGWIIPYPGFDGKWVFVNRRWTQYHFMNRNGVFFNQGTLIDLHKMERFLFDSPEEVRRVAISADHYIEHKDAWFYNIKFSENASGIMREVDND